MTIGISLLLHLSLVLGIIVVRRDFSSEELEWPPLPSLPNMKVAPPTEPESIDVIILDEPEVRTAVLEPPTTAPVPRAKPRMTEPAPSPPSTDAAPSPGPTAPAIPGAAPTEAPRSAFAMRAPSEAPGVDVALPRLPEGELPAPSAPTVSALRDPLGATPRGASTDELARQRDGTYRSKHDNFTANVDKDGRVRFQDRSSVRPGAGIDSEAGARGVDPSIRQDNSIGSGGVGGSMDVTEMVMRGKGYDPHAQEKLAFLDRTREQRASMAQERRTSQLSKSAVLMRRTLDEMWASTRDPAQRKETLFELWDECAETGDPEMVTGAVQARAEIMAFIRKRLHGPHAYTREEIAQLNARKKSKATFSPPTAG
ncbi:MAG: hypothetical protein SFX73_23605 [Kofleriaceae bacterium]|nr:hypothetical protein [Kofleriaceae bacterium]